MKKIIKSITQYFSEDLIDKIKKMVKFLFIYSIVFIFIAMGIKYAIPFVIAYFIALAMRPIKNKMLLLNTKTKKFKINDSVVSLILTLSIISILVTIVFGVGYKIFKEFNSFYNYLNNDNGVNEIYNGFMDKLNNILVNFDDNIIEKASEVLGKLITAVTGLLGNLANNILSLIISIPTAVIMVLITIIATFFFIKDVDRIHERVRSIFSSKGLELIGKIKFKIGVIFGGYLKALGVILIVLTIYTFIIYTLADVKYAFVLAIITALVDALPLFGAGIFYGILAIIAISMGNIKGVILLILGYIGVVVIRQYLEQKLVSSFLGIHPLIVIIALFLAFTPLGFIGTFYFLGAVLLYEVIS